MLQEVDRILLKRVVIHSYSEHENIQSILQNILLDFLHLSGSHESIYWKKYDKTSLRTIDISYYLLKNILGKHYLLLKNY